MRSPYHQVFRFLIYLCVISVSVYVYWLLYNRPLIGIDDSSIYFVYVKNFVNGHGFVYFPGGERVEGFTSILWVLLVSLFYVIDPDRYAVFIMVFNTILVSYGLFRCGNFIQKQIAQSPSLITIAEIFFLILLILIPGYLEWSVLTLMETGIWSVFIILITLQIVEDRIETTKEKGVLVVLLSLLVFIRPESLLWCFGFIVLLFIRYYLFCKSLYSAFRSIILPLMVVIFSIGALTVFRLYYFGYPLPNTYYAKVSADKLYNIYHGLRYLGFSLIQSPMLVLVIAGVVAAGLKLFNFLIDTVKSKRLVDVPSYYWSQFVLVAVAIVSIAIPVYVGGDHFKLLRFFQPFFPLYYLMFVILAFWSELVKVSLKFNRLTYYSLSLLLTAFIYLCTATPLHTFRKGESPIDWEFRLSELGRAEAEQMNMMFSRLGSLPTVGVSAAGGFAYSYQGKVIDLMGLNNVEMAHAQKVKKGIKNHAAFDKGVFYEQQPEVFHGYAKISKFVDSFEQDTLLENLPNFEEAFVSRLYKQIFVEPQFKELYRPVIIRDGASGLFLKTYVRKDFIARLRESQYDVKEIVRVQN